MPSISRYLLVIGALWFAHGQAIGQQVSPNIMGITSGSLIKPVDPVRVPRTISGSGDTYGDVEESGSTERQPSGGQADADMSDVVVTGPRGNNPIRLNVGQKLIFSLSANHAPNYDWQVRSDGESVISDLGRTETSRNPRGYGNPITGAAFTTIWTYEASSPGSQMLSFSYGRTAEMSPMTLKYHIQVK